MQGTTLRLSPQHSYLQGASIRVAMPFPPFSKFGNFSAVRLRSKPAHKPCKDSSLEGNAALRHAVRVHQFDPTFIFNCEATERPSDKSSG